MKKVLAFLMTLAMLLMLVACGTEGKTKKETNVDLILAEVSEEENHDDVTEETVENPVEPEEQKVPESMPSPEPDVATEAEDSYASNEIRADFKEAMDAYESFYDEYCDFMMKYSENPTNLTLLMEYSSLMSKAIEVDEAFEKWESEDLNSAELAYYLEVNNRVMQKLLTVTE